MTDIKGLNFLEKLGINVPRRIFYENEINSNPPFDECSLRLFSNEIKDYKQVENALTKLKNKRIIEDFSLSTKIPVFIYYLKPCKIKELINELKISKFKIEVYDVTSKDVLASAIVEKTNNLVKIEGENKGRIRRITREGIKEYFGFYDSKKNYLKVEGIINHKEIYEFFNYLIENFSLLPNGLIEFTIHKNKHGTRGEKFIAWEYIPMNGEKANKKGN